MEEALKKYNDAKRNLGTAASGVGSANSALLTAATALQFAIDKEVRDAQTLAASSTGVIPQPATQAQPTAG
jgi:hypothetical protein